MTAPSFMGLREDIAQHLAGLGLAQWSANGVYKKITPPAVYLGVLPDEAGPSIGLIDYHHGTTDTPQQDTGTPRIRVQFRIKGTRDPRYAQRVSADIYQALHEATHYQLGMDNGVRVLRSQRVLTSEERTDAGIYHRVDSYEFTLNP